ncbi:MAG TPA: hypothetical protein VE011_09195 [Candidatus Dormibacteraeota bacterium]|nr:hypothetical protein [Candidatus Dormibacteraeota bacterium]
MIDLDIDGIDKLDAGARGRLERFASIFDRLDASHYVTLADTTDDDAVDEAKADALAVAGRGRRYEGLRAAVRAFSDAATRAYSSRMSLTDTLLLYQSLPDRAEDRVRFLASVERVVVAVVLWDELGDDDRSALLGPWAELVMSGLEA